MELIVNKLISENVLLYKKFDCRHIEKYHILFKFVITNVYIEYKILKQSIKNFCV